MQKFVALFVSLGLICCAQGDAQIVDSVTFTNVEPGVAAPDVHSHILVNSGTIESLVFSGTITEINSNTWAREIVFDFKGSGITGASIELSPMTSFDGPLGFVVVLPINGDVNAGDLWEFSFRETFDDGNNGNGDGLPDASVDLAFEWRNDTPVEAVSNLGMYQLDDGFYARGGGGAIDHPYALVLFTVEADGIYSIESEWANGNGSIFDGYVYLFDEDDPFDGVTDSNHIAFNDDGPDGSSAGISRIESMLLEEGTVYQLLLTTFGGQPGNTDLLGGVRIFSTLGNNAFVENGVLRGDVNLDGIVDLLDVAPFVELLTNGVFQVEADINEDGAVDLLDVALFIDLLSGN